MQLVAGLFTLGLLLAFGDAAAVHKSGINHELCSWGSQYWCSSPKTATLCGRTEWCAINDWPYDMVQDLPCTVMQQLVKQARMFLGDSPGELSEHDMAMAVAKGCSAFKDDESRIQCKTIVTDESVLMKLIELLDSKLTTQSVAVAVGVCKKNIPEEKVKPCTRCEDVVTTAQNHISKLLTPELYKKIIDVPCQKLGQGQQLCQVIGESKYEDFRRGLLKARPSEVCQGETKCLSTSLQFSSLTSMDECSVCKGVVENVRALDRDQEIQATIRSLIKSVCSDLAQFEQLCDYLADDGLQLLFELIATELEPTVVCEKLELCSGPETKADLKNVLINTIPVPESSPSVKASAECLICEIVMKEVDLYIGANQTEQALEKFLNDICDRLPDTISKECEGFVTQYSPIVIQMLIQKLDPSVICKAIGVCTNSSALAAARLAAVTVVGDTECDMCQYVVTYVDNYLDKSGNQKEILKNLDTVCTTLFPSSNLSSKCKQFIEQYFPEVIQLLTEELKPKMVCEAIKLCPDQKTASGQKGRQPVDSHASTNLIIKSALRASSGEFCDLCKYVVTYLDTFLNQSSTEAEIEAFLDKVCAILPANVSQQCDTLVKQYGPQIVQLLLQGLQPDKVCSFLGLCSANQKAVPVSSAGALRASSQVGDELCDMCKLVITYLDTALGQNATEAEVEALLDKVCSILPTALQAECNALVKQYGPQIIQLLLKKLKPDQVCSAIGLCSAVSSAVPVSSAGALRASSQVGDELCDMCKLVITYLDTALGQNATEAEVEALLDKVCILLPAALQAECNALVKQYGPQIIQLLLKKLKPDQVCSAIGLCSAVPSALKQMSKPAVAVNDELCDLCKYAVTYIDTFLNQSSTEPEIEALLDKVCAILPASVSQQCVALVKQYGPQIVQLLLQELQPDQVCKALGLCSSNKQVPKQMTKAALQVGDELCDLCKYAVTYIDTFLNQSSTEAEIEALLEKVCAILPANVSQQCDALVKQYGPQIVQLLLQELQPDQVCKALGLCSSNKQAPKKISKPVLPASGEMCDICKYAVTYLDTFLNESSTQAEIEALLEKVCSILPANVSQQCDALIKAFGPQIIQMLLSELQPDQVCAALGLCTSKIRGSTECDLCKYVVTYLDTFLNQSSSEAEIEALLDKVCAILPASLTQQCDALVKEYGPLIAEMLKQELQPDQVCAALGLCYSNKKVPKQMVKAASLPVAKGGEFCDLCKYAVTYLDTFLSKNSTTAEIEALLDKVCAILPGNDSQECVALIKEYGPQIIQLLLSELQPNQVCNTLGLCSSNKRVLKQMAKPALPAVSGELCDLCKYVVTYMDTFLNQNSSEADIEALLEQVCAILPANASQECDALVKQYGPLILQLLKQELKPDKLCTALGLCSSSKQVSKQMSKPTLQVNDELCDLCKYAVTYIDTFLNQSSTEPEIEALLDKVCAILPASVSQQCVALVKQYGPQIVQLLLQELQPDQVCKTLGLCSSNKQVPKQMSKPTLQVGDELCDLCKYAVTYIDTFLNQSSTEAEIEALLEKVCAILPANVSQQCDALVKQYGPQIVQLLLQELQPDQVCKALGLCTSYKPASKQMAKSTLPVSGEMCDLCKYAVTYLDTFLNESSTQAEIEALLEKVCSILPANVSQQCDALIKAFGPQIIQMLLSELQPDQVCAALGLCSSYKPVVKAKVEATVTCEVCQFVMQQLDTLLSESSTQAEIEAALDKACNLVPSAYKSECQQLINTYSSVIIQMLLENIQPWDVCNAISLCKSNTAAKNVQVVGEKAGDAACAICEFVMKQLDTYLAQNSSEPEIEKVLDMICDTLPSTVATECEQLVEQYAPLIVQLLLAQIKPDKICKVLGLCTGDAGVQNVQVVDEKAGDAVCTLCEFVMQELDTILAQNSSEPEIEKVLDMICDTLPSTVATECEQLVEQYAPLIVQLLLAQIKPDKICKVLGLCKGAGLTVEDKQKLGDVTCVVCEFVMQQLDQLLAENSTQAQIEAALDKVCTILPDTIRSECENLLDTYAPIFLQLLVQKLKPDAICSALGICSGVQQAKAAPAPVEKVGDASCSLCEFVIQQVVSLLGSNRTEPAVEQALEKVCSLMPATIQSECDQLVQEYAPLIIQLLLQSVDPQKICTFIGLCKGMEDRVSAPVSVESNDSCALCEYIIKQVDASMEENDTQLEIEGILYMVCDTLPSTVAKECKLLVQQNLQLIVQLLIQQLDPHSVCSLIGICKKNVNVAAQYKTDVALVGGGDCAFCELIMKEVDALVGKESTADDVESALDRVCHVLPSVLAKDCQTWVDKYTAFVLQLVVEEAQPKQVCTFMGLCQSQHKAKASPGAVGKQKTTACFLCETIMQYFDNILAKNATQEEIIATLDKVCDILPDEYKNPCIQFLPMYTGYVVDLIEKEMPPNMICDAIKICVDDEVKGSSSLQVKVDVRKNEFCPLCLIVFKEVDNLLEENATKEDILDALDKVCDILPSAIKDECLSFVGLYLPYVVDLIVQELTPEQICEALAICTNSTRTSVKQTGLVAMNKRHPVTAGELCPLCIYVVQGLDQLLTMNSTDTEIEQALDQICNLLEPIRDQCEKFVALYTPFLIDLLKKKLEPTQLCTELGLCTNGSTAKLAAPAQKVELQVKDGPLCALCEYVIQYLDTMLGENATEKEIEAALDKVCDLIPATLKQECDQLVKQYTPLIVQLLKNVSPEQACTSLALCSSSASVTAVQMKAGPLCPICEFVMTQLDTMLQQNATQQQIEAALEQVCGLLPSTVKDDCDKFLQQYTPVLIQLLLQVSPSQVCSFLGVCTSQKHDMELKAGPFCPICEFVMTQLDSMLQQNATQQQIEAALEQVCGLLPSTVKDDCDKFLQQYTPVLIQLLLQVSPSQVCSFLGVCGTQNRVNFITNNGMSCTLCKYIITELDSTLAQDATQEQIEAALGNVCDKLPSSLNDDCKQFIQEWIPILVQLLMENEPSSVCAKLGACSSHKLLGNSVADQPVNVGADQLCPLCEFILQTLDGLISANATETEIVKALDKVCGILPATLKTDCDQFIAQYLPELVKLLLQETRPRQVCIAAGFCTNLDLQEVHVTKEKSGEFCALCELIATELDNLLGQNATEAEIEAALDKVCDLLPSTLQGECENLVEQYAPLIVQLLKQKLQPKQLCTALGLCSSKAEVHAPQVKAGELCALCELIATELDNLLGQNATEAEIEAALDKVCDLLPSTLQGECENLVEQYAPLIVQLLKQKLQPKQLCTALGLCSSKEVQAPQVKAGELCALCELIATELDNVLGQNATEAEIEAALDKVCDLLPSTLQGECENLVEQYAPLIVQLLKQKLQPKQLCTALGLCSSKKVHAPQVKAGELCALCELIATELDNLLGQNATEAEIEAALDKVCDLLPSTLQSECENLVEQYAPLIVQLLKQKLQPKQLCTALGLCSSKEVHAPQVKAGELCALCELIATELDNLLGQNATEAEIEAALDKVCDLLPSTLQSECENLVEQYAPLIVQLLKQKLQPKQLCTALGLCSFKEVHAPQVKAGELCALCELIATELDNLLGQNATEAEIEAALDKVCDLLPSTLQGECENLVEQYAPLIVQLLKQKLQPKQLCTALGLCSSKVEVHVPQVKAGELCALCELIATELDNLLGQNATEAEIEAALDKVCDLLPSTLQSECENLVEQYAPLIVQLLKQKLQPKQLCTALGLCSSKVAVHVSKVKSGEFCALCELIATELENMLGQNATQAEIEAALDKVCDLLPSSLQSECENLVEQYAPLIVKLLVQKLQPKQLCTAIGLCSSKAVVNAPHEKSGELCAICELIATELENMLGQNATEAEIEAALDKVCDLLPSALQSECENLVEQYAPLIVELLVQKLQPKQLCQALKLCSSEESHLHQSVLQESIESCTLCKFVMEEIQGLLKQPATPAAVAEVLDIVCERVPSKYQPLCEDLMKLFAPTIVEYIGKGFNPINFCQFIEVCEKRKEVVAKAKPLMFVSEKKDMVDPTTTISPEYPYCSDCKFALYELQTAFGNQYWRNESKTILYELCAYMKYGKDVCELLVDMNVDAVIAEIRAFRFPIEFCQKINFCEAPMTVSKDEAECQLCETLTDLIGSYMHQGKKPSDLPAFLTRACKTVVNKQLINQCTAMVESHTSVLVQLVTRGDSPSSICQVAKLCARPSPKMLYTLLTGGSN